MKLIKSEPKLPKVTVNKFENYFSQKNWDEDMYMDLENQEKKGIIEFKSVSSEYIKPRAKLSSTVNDKVSTMLTNKSKMGIMDSKMSGNKNKSIAKISRFSKQLPNKQEQVATSELLKIKDSLSKVCMDKEKLVNKKDKLQASLRAVKQRVLLYENIALKNQSKGFEQIEALKQKIISEKFNQEIYGNMQETLKSTIICHKSKLLYMKKNLEQKKISHQSLVLQMERDKKSESLQKNIKQKYQENQQEGTQIFRNNSSLAQSKVILDNRAKQLQERYESIEQYKKDQYDADLHQQNHRKGLKNIYTHKMLGIILSCNFNKFQKQFLKYEKCYATIRMSSTFHRNQQKLNPLDLTAIVQQFNLLPVYQQSFQITKTLQQRISNAQRHIRQLQQKRDKLFQKRMHCKLEDNVSNGQKKKRQKNWDQETKKLMARDERVEERKRIMIWVELWLKKQENKLGLKISKKEGCGSHLLKIIEYLVKETKQLSSSGAEVGVQ